MQHLPIPPFTHETALEKVQAAEDAWTMLDPEKIVLLCSPDCIWRSGDDSFQGRAAIRYFLKSKRALATQYHLTTELWAFTGNRRLFRRSRVCSHCGYVFDKCQFFVGLIRLINTEIGDVIGLMRPITRFRLLNRRKPKRLSRLP